MIDLFLSTLTFLFSLQVTVLVEQMGDERFFVRDAACRSLVAMLRSDQGLWLLPKIEEAMRHRDREIAWRARWAVEEFYNVWPSTARRIPWLDMLPEKTLDRARILDEYLARARAEVGTSGPPEWYEYRHATVYYLRDQLRAGVPRSQVIQLLDEMIVNENRYLARP